MSKTRGPALRVLPLSAGRWADFETLFGSNGACGGCWCMYWRLRAKDYAAGKGSANRRAFKSLVDAGASPGLLAYAGREAVGWLALEPRAAYPRLEGSRILAPVDARPVWSISCFFIKRGWRGQGVSGQLLKAAAAYASRQGAKILEAYPVDATKPSGAAFLWTGVASVFRKAGYREAARRSPTRPIMQLELK